MKKVNIPIFVPHKGCPFDCVFCNQKTITGVRDELDKNQIIELIESNLASIDRAITNIEIAFFGGTFTGIPLSQQIDYLEIANKYIKDGRIDGIRISTRPDYINEKILMFLKKYGVTTIELGVQSLDKNVLIKSKRGHTIGDVIRASNLIKYYEFELGLQMMIGLPGDNYNLSYKTAQAIVRLKPDCVRIYPTLVFKHTELCKMYKSGEYKALSLDDAIEYTSDLLQLFYSHNINVIRVGIQPTDELLNGSEVMGGPFHPAFKYLVEARMFRNALEEKINSVNNEVTVIVNRRDRANLVGHLKENIRYFTNVFPSTEFTIVESDEVERYKFNLIIDNEKNSYTIFDMR
ncbi:MAG: radical SAM protein [Clostridiales bacterium]|nr:radical SAM protein [Clostridiales bacterium]